MITSSAIKRPGGADRGPSEPDPPVIAFAPGNKKAEGCYGQPNVFLAEQCQQQDRAHPAQSSGLKAQEGQQQQRYDEDFFVKLEAVDKAEGGIAEENRGQVPDWRDRRRQATRA